MPEVNHTQVLGASDISGHYDLDPVSNATALLDGIAMLFDEKLQIHPCTS
jgi:hypothetical protein